MRPLRAREHDRAVLLEVARREHQLRVVVQVDKIMDLDVALGYPDWIEHAEIADFASGVGSALLQH
ncbi:MAG: hypothetical protein LC797_23295 [Chloroflexi bacterium]|nr:hypothetical protein [Chloroflexota bacterium]